VGPGKKMHVRSLRASCHRKGGPISLMENQNPFGLHGGRDAIKQEVVRCWCAPDRGGHFRGHNSLDVFSGSNQFVKIAQCMHPTVPKHGPLV
jgi:hypothetical protein